MDPWLRRHCTTCSGSIDPNTRIRFDARAREHTKGNVMSETTSEPAWFRIGHFWVTEGERKLPAFEGRMAGFGWMLCRMGEAVDLPPG
jgi:hypothetical protein